MGLFWNIFLFLSSVCFALFLGEAVIRWVLPQELGNWTYTRDGLTLHLSNFTQYSNKFGHNITTNSEGMRDREHSASKASGVFRILLLGDSFMEANQVKLEDAFSTLLADQLTQSARRPIEVINASVSGWGTDDQLTYLVRHGYRFSPDLVLVGVTLHNDVQDNQRQRFHSYVDGRLQEKRVNQLPATDFVILQVKEILASHSHLYQVLLKVKSTSWVRNEQEKLNSHVLGLLEKKQNSSIQQGWGLTRLLFREMKKMSAEMGAPVVVFLIPLRLQVSEQSLRSFLEAHDIVSDQIVLDRPQRDMTQIGSDEGIEVIDLLAEFRRSEKNSPDQLYLAVDGHWTAAGHRLASEIVANRLLSSGTLPQN